MPYNNLSSTSDLIKLNFSHISIYVFLFLDRLDINKMRIVVQGTDKPIKIFFLTFVFFLISLKLHLYYELRIIATLKPLFLFSMLI